MAMTWRDQLVDWIWDGQSIRLGQTSFGEGPIVLLLPALSSISTRREMRPLQEALGLSFRTIAVDWPGFGDLPRPKVDWRPDAYRAFLADLADTIRPEATIAAGHAAGYALAQAAEAEGSLGVLSLISPTWRGPLPTMTGRRMKLFRGLSRTVDLPAIGTLFYRLNVNRPVIGMMARGHVYDDPAWLTRRRLAEKLLVTEASGARFASFRFVAGELDPFQERDAFLAAAGRVKTPVQVIYAGRAPRKSKAEMTALAALANVQASEVHAGKLAVHEEHPDVVGPLVTAFLHGSLAGR
jgi:pimeloyl-ACP methyl ester carboxylesterase